MSRPYRAVRGRDTLAEGNSSFRSSAAPQAAFGTLAQPTLRTQRLRSTDAHAAQTVEHEVESEREGALVASFVLVGVLQEVGVVAGSD